ncbi:MAG: hypothetical protein ACRD6B_14600 [Bryobacteraceae bacterium]
MNAGSTSNARSLEDVRYMVMFLCEFAQDLLYRLIGRDIHFRAYITCADFAHYALENVKDVFYGEALIEAYLRHTLPADDSQTQGGWPVGRCAGRFAYSMRSTVFAGTRGRYVGG